jgi:hypothetical protein
LNDKIQRIKSNENSFLPSEIEKGEADIKMTNKNLSQSIDSHKNSAKRSSSPVFNPEKSMPSLNPDVLEQKLNG